MKKIFLIITSLVLTTSLFAQEETAGKINYGNRISKGVVLLNTGVSFQNNDSPLSQSKTFLFQIGSQFGISKHFTIDFSALYQNESYELNNIIASSKKNDKIFGIIPGATVFGNVGFGWLQPYLSIGIPIGFGTDVANDHYKTFGGLLSPGLNVYLSKRLALTANMGMISYQEVIYKDSEEPAQKSTEFSFTPNDLRFGLTFIFGAE